MEIKERSYEEFDRDDRWVRQFALRTDPWIMIEQWASDTNFRMIAMKGSSRRLYVKNHDSRWLSQYVDIKCTDGNTRLRIVAWMMPGWLAKMAALWRLKIPVNLYEAGWIGKRMRRQFTLELNVLLTRLHQKVMTGSTGFNLMDLRPETLAFGTGLILISLLFPALFLLQMPMTKAWLGYSLTRALHQFLWVAVPALVVAAIVALVYRFSEVRWIRGTTAGVLFAAILGFGGYKLHSDLSQHVTKVAFANCFEATHDQTCQKWLQSIPAEKRAEVIRQLDRLRAVVRK